MSSPNPLLKNLLATRESPPPCLLTGPGEIREEALRGARFLLCERKKGCGECSPCRRLEEGNHPDFLRLSPEKNTIRIDKIRELERRLFMKPMESDRIVVVIESADQMTDGAANALLKTLETPPPYVVFLLVTSVPERIPATVRSRCQTIRLEESGPLLLKQYGAHLPFWREKILPEFFEKQPIFSRASRLAEICSREMEDLMPFMEFLKVWWRDLAVYQSTGDAERLHLARREELEPMAARRPDKTFRDMELIAETERALEGHVLKQLALERLFMGLVQS